MWCRPVPSSVSPMYMPGRLRTASRPRSTLIESASYSSPLPEVARFSSFSLMIYVPEKSVRRDRSVGHAQDLRTAGKRLEKFGIGARHPALDTQSHHIVEQRHPAFAVEMGGNFIEQQQRRPASRQRHQPCMGERDRHEDGLLLARGALGRGHIEVEIPYSQIAAVRPHTCG